MKKRTRVNHPPHVELPPDNRPVVAPIYQTVKFEFENVEETLRAFRGERAGFFYMRASNPTTRQLELLLAELQGREDCLVSASGVNAIAQTLIALTKQGDHVVCFVETYKPTLLSHPPPARALRRDAHAAVDRGPRRRRARARRAADAPRVLREPDESRDEDRGHSRAHAPGARPRRAHRARQHLRGFPPARRVRHRRVRAQPDEVRIGHRRRHGRCGDRERAISSAACARTSARSARCSIRTRRS